MDKKGLPIIIYAGTEYVLSHWCGTNGRRLLKRMWLSTTHSFAAATIIKRKRGYGYIVMSPDGQLMDVGVCLLRRDAKLIIQKILDDFVGQCSIPHDEMSNEFRQWFY